MRLTLRTLLAYLDDMLEPNQAKEIGAKIAESGVAGELADRIREVMRRRRIGAPAVDGPHAPDPNTVAEYLDNTLSPEAVADLERICLESDVNLAEVAAAHQILTLVLGEPAEVPPRVRERMYALGPAERSPAESEQAASIAPAGVSAAGRESFAQTIPEYLRPAPVWRRAVPLAFVAAIVIVWGILILGDRTFLDMFRRQGPPAVAAHGEKPPAVVPAAPEHPAVAEAKPDDDGEQPAPPAALGGLPDEGDAPRVAAADPRPGVGAGDEIPAGVEPPPAVVGEQLPPVEPPKPPQIAAPRFQYQSPAGIVLRYGPALEDWYPLPRQSAVQPGEWLACPEPFEAEFDLDSGRARVKLAGGTGVRYAAPPPGADCAFEIERGAVLIERLPDAEDVDAAAPGEQRPPFVVSIVVRDETWSVSLATGDAKCGIEIIPLQPSGFEQELGRRSYEGAILAVAGTVRFGDAGGARRAVDLAAGEWSPLGPAPRADEAADGQPSQPQTLVALPAWLDPQAARISPAMLRSRRLFEREFAEEQPLGPSMAPEVRNPDPLVSELAVKCLALTGQHETLAQALARAPHEESRIAAIVGLRVWLGQNPGQGQLVRADLQGLFPPETVEVVYRLLWGFSVADARDPARSAELVRWLDHEDLAVRQLAIFHIRNFTGRTLDYLPHDNNIVRRQSAVMRWQRHLDKEGALLLPVAP